jgi:CxxC-x17-CxxC domain-containing protein
MALEDKTLQCADCGINFTWSGQDQEFFQSKGYTNAPKRCPTCRANRKAERGGGGGGGGGGGSSYGGGMSRGQSYPATCAQCGKATQVPFQPRGDRPVYCSDCYRNVRR